jgi:hypothetical protein
LKRKVIVFSLVTVKQRCVQDEYISNNDNSPTRSWVFYIQQTEGGREQITRETETATYDSQHQYKGQKGHARASSGSFTRVAAQDDNI